MLCFASNLAETLVSSQKIISESDKASNARRVISRKLPIEVLRQYIILVLNSLI
jgi:hypothetical protein